MTRKLLILGALFVISVLGFQKPATAIFVCGFVSCGNDPDEQCICPSGTPAAGQVMSCGTWYADCRYW